MQLFIPEKVLFTHMSIRQIYDSNDNDNALIER